MDWWEQEQEKRGTKGEANSPREVIQEETMQTPLAEENALH
jgi:hypothetical protein